MNGEKLIAIISDAASTGEIVFVVDCFFIIIVKTSSW